jgi:hypothetical protein
VPAGELRFPEKRLGELETIDYPTVAALGVQTSK